MSQVIKYVGNVIGIKYVVITFTSNSFILRRPRVANFVDIIKIAIMFIIATFKDSKNVKGIRNYVL